MIAKNLCTLLLVYLDLRTTFAGAAKITRRSVPVERNWKNNEIIGEKKIRFTGNSDQYVEFNVTIPHLLDFAMCLWYKPEQILNQNILFSYGRDDRQLIIWKIKKKHGRQTLILKLYDTVVMEQSIDNLVVGRWYHLCQYWKGSIGLWAAFINRNIQAFGYKEIGKNGSSRIDTGNATATLNHPRTKRTLHGEIYGFHMMSIRSLSSADANRELGNIFQLLMALHKSNSTSDLFLLLDNTTETGIKFKFQTRRKRQLFDEASTPETVSTPSPPFSRIRSFLRFVRRVVQVVTLPVIRFAQGLVMPWRRALAGPSPTPTSTPIPRPPTTTTRIPPITTGPSTVESTLATTAPTSSTSTTTPSPTVETTSASVTTTATSATNSTLAIPLTSTTSAMTSSSPILSTAIPLTSTTSAMTSSSPLLSTAIISTLTVAIDESNSSSSPADTTTAVAIDESNSSSSPANTSTAQTLISSIVVPSTETSQNKTRDTRAEDLRTLFTPIDLNSLEPGIVVYESDSNAQEPRGFRALQDLSADFDSAEIFFDSREMNGENDRLAERKRMDTCEMAERKFADTNDAASGDDAITHLGAYLQFVQLLFTCCYMRRDDVLISWVQTPARIINAVSERASECGNF